MVLAWLLSSLHLLALAIGLGALWVRGHALRSTPVVPELPRAFAADAFWGVAVVLWIATGFVLALHGVERAPDSYFENRVFLLKMGLLVVVLVLEIWPTTLLLQWRQRVRRGLPLSTEAACAISRISFIQAGLVVLMVFAATAATRGLIPTFARAGAF